MREYKDVITGKKFKGQVDEEAMKHEEHCHINIIKKGNRTLYSCNCSKKEEYRKRFLPNTSLRLTHGTNDTNPI